MSLNTLKKEFGIKKEIALEAISECGFYELYCTGKTSSDDYYNSTIEFFKKHGFLKDKKYCDETGVYVDLKEKGEACSQDYECESHKCKEEKCGEKIAEKIKNELKRKIAKTKAKKKIVDRKMLKRLIRE